MTGAIAEIKIDALTSLLPSYCFKIEVMRREQQPRPGSRPSLVDPLFVGRDMSIIVASITAGRRG
jgi:hypothetical protein